METKIILLAGFITNVFVKSQLEAGWLFFFGDNCKRYGFSGLAAQLRDEPNTFGIPTKADPKTRLYDIKESPATQEARLAWNELTTIDFFASGWKQVVIPFDEKYKIDVNHYGISIGCGLAQMPKTCPINFERMLSSFHKLIERYGVKTLTIKQVIV